MFVEFSLLLRRERETTSDCGFSPPSPVNFRSFWLQKNSKELFSSFPSPQSMNNLHLHPTLNRDSRKCFFLPFKNMAPGDFFLSVGQLPTKFILLSGYIRLKRRYKRAHHSFPLARQKKEINPGLFFLDLNSGPFLTASPPPQFLLF